MSDINEWFSGSRAAFLVIPRILLEDMPIEWQSKMKGLLDEYDAAYDHANIGVDGCSVRALDSSGRIIKMPDNIKNYRRPDKDFVNSIRK